MRSHCTHCVVVTLVLLSQHTAFAANQKDRLVLLEGVSEIAVPGTVGSLSVYGPDAIVLATGEVKSGQPAAVIAVASLGQGRLVAMGHNGYLSRKNAQIGQTGKLMTNMILWAAGLHESQTSQLRIGVFGNRELANGLKQSGLKTTELKGNWSSNLRGMNLVIGDPRSLSRRDATKLIEFAKAGNGLMLGTAGWVWQGYTAKPGETLVDDFPGNIIGSQAGILWDSPTVTTPVNKRFAIPKELPESVHALAALQAIKENPQGKAET